MSNVGKWETVVKKKKSHITKSDVKKAQQKFIEGEKVPKVEQRGETNCVHYIHLLKSY